MAEGVFCVDIHLRMGTCTLVMLTMESVTLTIPVCMRFLSVAGVENSSNLPLGAHPATVQDGVDQATWSQATGL